MGPVLYQLYFKTIPRFKTPAEQNLKIKLETKKLKTENRKENKTRKK
jgi:hypothetical protein